MTFFVLGLPRSRTAWIANFLTYDGLFCYHDGTNGCKSIEEYKKKVNGKGDSNTGLMFFDFEKYFDDVKIIIIDSGIDKSVNFGRDVFNEDIRAGMEIGKTRLDNTDGLHVNLNDVDSKLRDIWEYVSDKPFNQKRADMLSKMDIQVKNPLDIDFESASKFFGTVNAITQ